SSATWTSSSVRRSINGIGRSPTWNRSWSWTVACRSRTGCCACWSPTSRPPPRSPARTSFQTRATTAKSPRPLGRARRECRLHPSIHPLLGGRLQWAAASEKGTKDTLFRLTLSGGDELRFLDSVRMGRVYWVPAGALPTVTGWAELGPDALEVSQSDFAHRIRRHPGELKNLLRNQAFVAGIGNAYSGEILHRAELLPLRKRSTLKPDDVSRLHTATQQVLGEAIAAIRAQPHYVPQKQDRSFMAVHGKGGQKCPRCGHRISELKARGETTNFCRGCQH